MPPEIKRIQTEKTPKGRIKKVEPYDAVVGFYAMDGVDVAVQASQFDVEEEVRTLIRHIRDKDPKVSLAALRQFRSVLREVMQANGMIGSVQHTQLFDDEDGRTRNVVATQALLSRIRENNERANHNGIGHEYFPSLDAEDSPKDVEGSGPGDAGHLGE